MSNWRSPAGMTSRCGMGSPSARRRFERSVSPGGPATRARPGRRRGRPGGPRTTPSPRRSSTIVGAPSSPSMASRSRPMPSGWAALAATFAGRDVVDQLARRLPPGTSAEGMLRQLETLADRFLTERAVVVARDEQLAEERYSTPELLAIEQRMLDGATARVDAGAAVVAPEHLRATLEAFPSMGQDQADALTDLTRSGAGVSLLVGKAGYGKTYLAGAVAHAYGLQGHGLIGTAPTGLAATGLGNEGYGDARTVDRLLADLEQRRDRDCKYNGVTP